MKKAPKTNSTQSSEDKTNHSKSTAHPVTAPPAPITKSEEPENLSTKESVKTKKVVVKRTVRKKDGTVVITKVIKIVPITEDDRDKPEETSIPIPDVTEVAPIDIEQALVTKKKEKLIGWDWYKSIGCPRWILSPMVGQSELAYRMLCRNHGVQLAYTPMFIASRFVESKEYRKAVWQTCPQDRPLTVQFCGNDPNIIVQAAKMVENQCDAIDINLGCPQEVAKRGNYGSYLMDNTPLVEKIVKEAATKLQVPVTVKIRVYDSFTKTLDYCKMLEKAGASLITIHGRQRHHREEVLCDWQAANALRPHLSIPVILNGDLWHAEDIALCLEETTVDGYMSAQGILHNPALFEPLIEYAKNQGPLPPQPEPQSSARSKKTASKSHVFEWNAPLTESQVRQRRPLGSILSHALAFSYNHPLNKHEISQRSQRGQLSEYFHKPFSSPEEIENQFNLAHEYIECIKKYPVTHQSIARRHIFFMLFDNFQSNLDQYVLLCEATEPSEYDRIITTLYIRCKNGTTMKTKELDDGMKRLARRRDGTIAPPPWPVGGGGLNEINSTKRSQRDVDPADAFEIDYSHKKHKKGKNMSHNQQKSQPKQSTVFYQNHTIDMSKFD